MLTNQITAASRQVWAFSRDGALPFSNVWRHVSHRIRYQPVNAIIGLIVVSIIFGLLCLINSVAANALFSLFVASNYVAWGVPILCRLVWGKHNFQPGEFYMGFLSKPIAIVAVVWLLFGLVLSMFPSDGPNPSRKFSLPFCNLRGRYCADDSSGLDELHYRAQRLCVDCQCDVLHSLRAQVVHWPEDDGRGTWWFAWECIGGRQ